MADIDSQRSAPGTKLIRFEGGPPEWDGVVSAVSKTGGGQAERWDHTADLALVFQATERTAPVEVEHRKRSGVSCETKQAQVYECLGYREELQGVE